MDNPKVAVRKTHLGKGLVALKPIAKDEVIAEFDGPTYKAKKASLLPADVKNHVIQIAQNAWKDSIGIARNINHSCEPNCGIKDLIKLVAIRDIQQGEELFLDYEMTERSDWQMKCLCGSKSCRKIIGSFDNLPADVRRQYDGYISGWLIN